MRAKYLGNGDRREPAEISEVIGSIIEGTTVHVDIRHGRVVEEWDRVAGDDWRLATPVGVRDGILLVTVPDGATASLVRYQVRPLLAAISAEFGDGLVTGVRIRVDRQRSAGESRE